ncbi:rubredoxin [Bradyrhizobium sp. WSM471]|uniref:rubredoxin n=1 Tax=Bradyrhizobium sp. WSM471 TaxID=319017 RepID=UPI00024D245A|nr:rubredoxin [Bradyrhizobium sp. WSM471]
MSNESAHLHSETAIGAPVYKTWMCALCGVVYSEREGWPHEGIPPGTRWEDVPDEWICPDCGADKSEFQMTEV